MSKIKNKLGCEKVDRLKLSRCLLPRRSSDTLFTKTNVTTGEPALFLVYSDGLVGRCLLLCLMPNRDWLRRASCSLVVLIKKLHRNSLPPVSRFFNTPPQTQVSRGNLHFTHDTKQYSLCTNQIRAWLAVRPAKWIWLANSVVTAQTKQTHTVRQTNR